MDASSRQDARSSANHPIVAALPCPGQRLRKQERGPERQSSPGPRWCSQSPPSAVGELEALAGALAAVFLALLHAAIPGQEARVAQFLRHGHDGLVGLAVLVGLGGLQAEVGLQGAGDTLAAGAGLAGGAAAL